MKVKKLKFIIICLFSINCIYAQHFRISLDLTIKEKSDSVSALYMGQLFYDIHAKQLIYNLSFPNTERWVFTDSAMYIIRNNKIAFVNKNSPIETTNIFYLILTQQLNTYGLNKAPFIHYQTQNVGGLKVHSYKPKVKGKLGNIDLAYSNKVLSSVVFFQPKKNTVLMKQFFKDYISVKNVQVPTNYYQLIYIDKKEILKKYQFKNIKIDDSSQDENYYIDLSKLAK